MLEGDVHVGLCSGYVHVGDINEAIVVLLDRFSDSRGFQHRARSGKGQDVLGIPE
jgi:hypothetical protein